MALSHIGYHGVTGPFVVTVNSIGDILIVCAFRNGSTTPPTMPGTYSAVMAGPANGGGGTNNSAAIGWRVATAANEGSGTWTNATAIQVIVMRGQKVAGPIGNSAEDSGSSTSTQINYPAVALSVADGTSALVAFGMRQTTGATAAVATAPTDLTNRGFVPATPYASAHSQLGRSTNWPSKNVATTGSVKSIGVVIEILEEPPSIVAPTVATQAASSVTTTTATGNGNITNTGGANADERGIVYSTSTHGDPGNVSPASSSYGSVVNETGGSFSTGAFTESLTSLASNTTYYARAYAHNSAGYAYGSEVSFTTVISFNDVRQGIIDGFDSAQSEAHGWDVEKANIAVTAVVRTSDTVVTITLPALAAYDITADEHITATIPAAALTGGSAIIATPTFDVTAAGGGTTEFLTLTTSTSVGLSKLIGASAVRALTMTGTPSRIQAVSLTKVLTASVAVLALKHASLTKAASATVAVAITIGRVLLRTLSATATGTVSILRAIGWQRSVTATGTPTKTTQIGTTKTLTVTPTVIALKQPQPIFAVTAVGSPTLRRLVQATRTVTASMTATFSVIKVSILTLSTSASVAVSRLLRVSLDRVITATATPSALRSISTTQLVTASVTSTLRRAITTSRTVTTAMQASVAVSRAFLRTLTATATLSASVLRQAQLVLRASGSGTVTIRRAVDAVRRVTAHITVTHRQALTITKTLTVSPVAHVFKRISTIREVVASITVTVIAGLGALAVPVYVYLSGRATGAVLLAGRVTGRILKSARASDFIIEKPGRSGGRDV